jgi:uncharacterized phage protein gp47/JayE
MAFFERTTDEIVSSALSDLSRYSNITRLTPGAKARLLLDIVSKEQGNQHQVFDENILQVFLKYADSKFLDFFGDMMNLPRREATHAFVEDENFMFFVNSGTFGSINGGSNFLIPAGTLVFTTQIITNVVTPGIEPQPVIRYVTTEDITAFSNLSYVYAPIRASIEGSESRVERGLLQNHNFTGYLSSSTNPLKCTNKYSISNGDERESTESYRYRLQNIFKARQLAIPMAVRLAALSVPGVSNVKEVLCEQGPGTASLYVLTSTPTTSQSLLEEVNSIVAKVTGLGNRIFVLAPEPLGIELICAVNWSTKATADDISRGYIRMRDSLSNRLGRVDMGEEVTFADLRDTILNSSEFAISIGDNQPNKFEEKYIYRRDPVTNGATRNLTEGDKIVPLYNERVILETSGTNHGIKFLTRQG